MSFQLDTVDNRIAGLAGGPAEDAFVRVMDADGYALGRKLFRFGLEKLPTEGAVVPTLTSLIRHAPDFVQVGGHMWEVQGCGQDRTFTFKQEKLQALWSWFLLLNQDGRDLRFALYVQPDNIVYRSSFEHVLWACYEKGDFSEAVVDDKPGWRVHAQAFEWGQVTSLADTFRALKV
jgi:hypothetical protein